RVEWRDHRAEAIGVAVLAPLSYILVLTAMQFTPVSYVAPAREISILIGTAMGTRLLAEGDVHRRLAAAAAMVVGVVVLAVGLYNNFNGSNRSKRSKRAGHGKMPQY